MIHYKIEITENALEDLEKIYSYISKVLGSTYNAKGQYERIVDQILKLETLPKRFPIIDSEPEHTRAMRIMPVDNYLVIYIIKQEKVIITNILYSGSNIHERLK